jgi:hypothetical protein
MNALSSVLSLLLIVTGPGNSPMEGDSIVCSPQSTFRIPIDLAAEERQGISAIRLFVSQDQGRTWTRHSDGDPAMEVVTFRANQDGEYWFTIALVDRSGVQAPADVRIVEPGLKVLVDTRKPDLQVKAIRNRAGRRGIRWTFDDSNVLLSTYRLAVRDESTGQWREYDVRHPEEKMVWFTEDESFSKLQASIKDRAGNERVIELEVIGEQFSRKDVNAFVMSDRDARPDVVPVSAQEPAMDRTSPPSPAPVQPAVVRESFHEGAVPSGIAHSAGVAAESNALNRTTGQAPRPIPSATARTVAPIAEPAGETTFCSSNHIVVNYVVESVAGGSAPVAELWASRDDGQRWSLVGVDEDGRSPIETKLPAEGAWGLKIVMREGSEPTDGPTPGSRPEMMIEVDTTAPEVRVAPVAIVDGRVVIRWEANDPHLDAQPIDILYGSSPRGPWRPVATGLRNVGEYVWDVAGTGVPAEVYLRVEARDRARHVGFGQLREPARLLNDSR